MESIAVRAEIRPRGSKGSVNALRRQGMLPAVVYGKNAGNIMIVMSEKELRNILVMHNTGSTLIKLQVENESYPVMLREVQRNPIRQTIKHADFIVVSLTEAIETEIHLHLVGEAAGTKEGGVLQHLLRDVTVSCLPTQMPEMITADVSAMNIGDQLTVRDLQAPPDVTILTDLDSIIALVVPPAGAEPASASEATVAEPAEGEE